MIAIIDIVLAAAIGVAVATLLEGRWGPLLVVTPLVGALHGALLLIPRAGFDAAPDGSPLAILGQLADPWLLAASMVACATGSVLAAIMLGQSRQARATSFWLPDMDRPRGGIRASSVAPRLSSRMELGVVSRTRRLVEEGYAPEEPTPVFDAGPAPLRTPSGAEPSRPRPPEPPPEANNRRAARRRTVLAGRLLAEGGVSVPCTISNLSTTGAALRLPSEIALPRNVSLIDVSNGIGHRAQVRWRRRESLGVRFLSSFDLNVPEGPDALAMARQWAALRT